MTKLVTSDWHTRLQPSTSTKSRILNGVEIITGGNMNMPIESSTTGAVVSRRTSSVSPLGRTSRTTLCCQESASRAATSAAAGSPVSARAQLEAVTRWAMQTQLEGEMPSLPAQNSALRGALMTNSVYMGRLMEVSDKLGVIDALLFKCNVLWAQLDALYAAYVAPGMVPPGAFRPEDWA